MKYYASWILLKDIYYPKDSGKIVTAVGPVFSALIMVNKLGKHIGVCMHFGRWIWMYGNNDIYGFTGKCRILLEKGRVLIVQGQVNFNNFNGDLKITAYELMDIS